MVLYYLLVQEYQDRQYVLVESYQYIDIHLERQNIGYHFIHHFQYRSMSLYFLELGMLDLVLE
jgi:hypothetical protein